MAETFELHEAIYLDAFRPSQPLLSGTSSTPVTAPLTWVQDDDFELRVYFRKRGSLQTTSSSLQLAAGLSMVLGAKLKVGSQIQGPLLVFQDTWTKVTDGDEVYYKASINLDTIEMDAATGSDPSAPVTVQVDIELGNRKTYKFDVTIVPQAYGGEGAPTPALGSVNPPRVINGVLQLYNADTDTWVALTVTGDHNQITRTEV
jgi:hypothetical protein